jgi:nicotinate-nucleotide adenylyltransferase
VAQAAWEQLSVDVVTFIPAGDPWQKSDDRSVTPAAVRCKMVAAAVQGVPHFELDRREADREGPTFTWDTLHSFGDDAVVLVLGSDAAAGVRTWHRGDELVEATEIAVVGRPGTAREEVESAVGRGLRWLEMPALDLSSTELRQWIARGFSGRYLIPDAVLEVIDRSGLYRDGLSSGRPVE